MIDVSGTPYAIPPDNPFVGVTGDDEIWAYGLRNPWRCSFDRATGDLYIGDVGQGAREEVSYLPASSPGGENFGWRCMEGSVCATASGCSIPTGCGCPGGTPGLTAPVYDYPHNPAPPPTREANPIRAISRLAQGARGIRDVALSAPSVVK